jgi:hypothetical protein
MVLSLMNLDTYNQKKKNEKGAFVQLFESFGSIEVNLFFDEYMYNPIKNQIG